MVDQEGDRGQDSYKKRRVIVDRFARFKMHEAAMAEVAAAAGAASGAGTKDDDAENSAMNWADGDNKTGPDKRDYRTEPYQTHLLPGEEMVHDNTGRKVFLGAPAGKSMLRRASQLDGFLLIMAASRTHDRKESRSILSSWWFGIWQWR
jgi:hypothetical protein